MAHTNNYYLGYLNTIPPENITEFEAAIVGTIEQNLTLSNGQIVVKTPDNVHETPVVLSGFEMFNEVSILAKIDEIEGA